MDPTSAVGAVLAAFGLAGAAGLNAWLPLFAAALLARAGAVELDAPFDDLQTTTGLVVLGALFAVDLVGDKIPAVDSALHAVGTIIAPVSGAALFAGQSGAETDVPTLVAVVLGAVTAGSVHAGRATARPAATATTAGTANPFVSLTEDVVSGLLVVAAFVVPVIAFLAVVALLGGLGFVGLRVRRAVRRRRGGTRT